MVVLKTGSTPGGRSNRWGRLHGKRKSDGSPTLAGTERHALAKGAQGKAKRKLAWADEAVGGPKREAVKVAEAVGAGAAHSLLAKSRAHLTRRIHALESEIVAQLPTDRWIAKQTVNEIDAARGLLKGTQISKKQVEQKIFTALAKDQGSISLGDHIDRPGVPDLKGVTKDLVGQPTLSTRTVLLLNTKAGFMDALSGPTGKAARLEGAVQELVGLSRHLDNLSMFERFGHFTSRQEVKQAIEKGEAATVDEVFSALKPLSIYDVKQALASELAADRLPSATDRSAKRKKLASDLLTKLRASKNPQVSTELDWHGNRATQRDTVASAVFRSVRQPGIENFDYELAWRVASLFRTTSQVGGPLLRQIGEVESMRSFLRDFVPAQVP